MMIAVTQRHLSTALRTQLRSPSIYPIIGHASRVLAQAVGRPLSTAAAVKHMPCTSICPTHDSFDINGQIYYPQNASDLASEARKMDELNKHLIKRFSPHYEIDENALVIKVKINLPHAKAEDLSAHIEDGNLLHVGGWVKVPEESEENPKRFDKRFTIGASVNLSKVAADFESDVLTISAPKTEFVPHIQIIPVRGK